MVLPRGLEPLRNLMQRILSPVCLPIPSWEHGYYWCPWWDLNPHDCCHKHLKLACLPISTHGHKGGSRVLSAPKESEVVNPLWVGVCSLVMSILETPSWYLYDPSAYKRKRSDTYDDIRLARAVGFEPTTTWTQIKCSTKLSYARI